MGSQKCSNEKCKNDIFENNSQCILHCKKYDWVKTVNTITTWDNTKVATFWKAIRYEIKYHLPMEEMRYNKVIFPKFEDYIPNETSSITENIIGNFLNDEPNSNNIIYEVYFNKCTFLDDALFINYIFTSKLTFNECICLKEIQFLSCELNKILNISSSSFDGLRLSDSKTSHITIDQSLKSDFTNNLINEIYIDTSNIEAFDTYALTVNEFTMSATTLDNDSSMGIQYFEDLHLRKLKINSSFEISGASRKYSGTLSTYGMSLSDNSRVIIRDLSLNEVVLSNDILAGNKNLSILNVDIDNKLLLDNCILDNATFNNIKFGKMTKVYINDTQVDKCIFYNMKWKNDNLNMLNAETLNQIKYSYDTRGNIIEGNKFYALEMSAKSKEKMSWKDKIIFKLHNWSSNHSQDWFRPLLLIVLITMLYSLSICSSTTLFNQIAIYMDKLHIMVGAIHWYYITLVSSLLLMLYWSIKNLNSFLVLFLIVLFVIYLNYCDDGNFQKFVNNLNFASLFKEENKTTGMFILNLIQAYLSYQFIISIRQIGKIQEENRIDLFFDPPHNFSYKLSSYKSLCEVDSQLY